MENQPGDESAEIEQTAREARIKHLIEHLDATISDEHTSSDMVRTVLLQISVEKLIPWLQQKSRLARKRKFPLGGGYLTMQDARLVKNPAGEAGDAIVLTMDGLLHDGGATFLQYKQILFTIFPLAAGGIALQVKCNQPAVAPYYNQLLSELSSSRIMNYEL